MFVALRKFRWLVAGQMARSELVALRTTGAQVALDLESLLVKLITVKLLVCHLVEASADAR